MTSGHGLQQPQEDQCHDAAEKDAGLGQNGYEMPPADFRFNKTKTDYWRGRSEEARVFAESMGITNPKQSCSASQKNTK